MSSLFEARDSFFALPGSLINLCAAAGDEVSIKALDSLDMTAMRMMKGMAALSYGLSMVEEMPDEMRSEAQYALAEFQSLIGELIDMHNTAEISKVLGRAAA